MPNRHDPFRSSRVAQYSQSASLASPCACRRGRGGRDLRGGNSLNTRSNRLAHGIDLPGEGKGADLRSWLCLGRNIRDELVLPLFGNTLLIP